MNSNEALWIADDNRIMKTFQQDVIVFVCEALSYEYLNRNSVN